MITEFGKLLRIIRINTGDSARTMAEKFGMSPSYPVSYTHLTLPTT